MQSLLKKIKLLSILLLLLASCHKDDAIIDRTYSNGYYVTCEGSSNGTGTLSFIDKDYNVTNSIIEKSNDNISLGNIVQSMYIHESKGYTLVNNSKKMVITQADNGKVIYEKDGFILPRYFIPTGSAKAYISDWGSGGINGSVIVYDLNNRKFSQSIKTGNGPEKMLLDGNKLYVANVGGFGFDSTVSVINTNTDQLDTTYTTANNNPQSLAMDAKNNIWILCTGSSYGRITNSGLFQIVNKKCIKLLDLLPGAKDLQYNPSNNSMYFIYVGKVKVYNIDTKIVSDFTTQKFKSLYSLFLDVKNNKILMGDAEDFVSNGSMYIFDITSADLLKKVVVGVGPGGIIRHD